MSLTIARSRSHLLLVANRTSFLLLLNLLAKLILDLRRLPRLGISIEDHVNFLEGPTRGLWIHEEYVKGHDEAEDGEDDIRLPLDVVERRRDKVCQRKVENPVSGR